MYNLNAHIDDKISKENIVKQIRRLTEHCIIKSVEGKSRLALALSGGIDSVVCAWVLKQLGAKFDAYTVHFGEYDYNRKYDLIWARKAAEEIGVNLHEVIVSVKELDDNFDKILALSKTPSKNKVVSAAGWFFLGRQMKADGIKTLVCGEMNDELYASYAISQKYNYGSDEAYEKHRLSLVRNAEKGLNVYKRMIKHYGINMVLPYTDEAYVNFCLTIPGKYRKENKRMKPLFRLAYSGDISDEILWREKQEQGKEVDAYVAEFKQRIKDFYNNANKMKNLLSGKK